MKRFVSVNFEISFLSTFVMDEIYSFDNRVFICIYISHFFKFYFYGGGGGGRCTERLVIDAV